MSEAPKHSVSVAGAIVRDDGRVLLVRRRDNGHWEPPGGVLDLEESIPEGLERELLEETGLHVQVDTLTGVYKNVARGIVALVFRCRPGGGGLAASAETDDFLWAHEQELDGLVQDVYAIRLRDALHYRGQPAVRTHDGIRVVA